MHRTFTKLLAQTGINRLRKTRLGTSFNTINRYIVKLGINDLPLNKRINQNVFFLGSNKAFWLGTVEGQYPVIKITNVLNQRQFEVQTRLGNNFAHLSKLKNNRELPLINGKNRRSENGEYHRYNNGHKIQSSFHYRSPRSRERRASRGRVAPLSTTCGGVSYETTGAERACAGISALPPTPSGDCTVAPAACISLSRGK